MRKRRRGKAVLAAGLLLGATAALPARADTGSEVGWQIGSAVSTVVYAPVKLLYATAGLVFGGIGWGLSGGDPAVVEAAIAPAVRGDYLVTPAHLRGERRLRFVGAAPDPAESAQDWDAPEPDDPYASGIDYGDWP